MQELDRRMVSATDVGHRAGLAADPARDQGAGAVHQRGAAAGRLLHAGRGRRRLAAGGDDHARAGRRGRHDGVGQHRGARARRRARVASARVRTDRGDIEAERVVIACGCWSPRIARMAGARIPLSPAVHQMIDIGPVRAVRRRQDAGRLPDRARHGHQHVRAPGRRRAGDRLLRPPPDHARRRRDPLDRGVGAQPDRAAVHPAGLRAADGAGARADARDRRRRVGRRALRDQRPAVGDLRRDAADRRDAGGARDCGRRRRSGSRRDRAPASRWPS